ncbi:cobalt ECF transporter T component CbiQ [candidate division KSB1 bacterium]
MKKKVRKKLDNIKMSVHLHSGFIFNKFSTWISKIDPRINLGIAVLFIFAIVLNKNILTAAIFLLFALLLLISTKISTKKLILLLSLPLFQGLFFLILQGFWKNGVILWQTEINGIYLSFTKEGFLFGLLILIKMLSSFSIMILLGQSTSLKSFIASLSWFRMPVVIVEIMYLMIRFIIILFSEAALIFQAQKLRGGYGSFKKNIKSLGYLTSVLLNNSYNSAKQSTTALQLRGGLNIKNQTGFLFSKQ